MNCSALVDTLSSLVVTLAGLLMLITTLVMTGEGQVGLQVFVLVQFVDFGMGVAKAGAEIDLNRIRIML